MRHAVLSILIAASALTAILFVAILLPKANFASSPQGESSNLSQSASKSSSVNGKSDDITYVPNPESVAVDLYLYINKIDNYPLNASWVHPVKLSDNELSEYPVLGDGIKNIPVDSQPGTGYYYISSSTTPRLTSANATQLLNAIKNLGLQTDEQRQEQNRLAASSFFSSSTLLRPPLYASTLIEYHEVAYTVEVANTATLYLHKVSSFPSYAIVKSFSTDTFAQYPTLYEAINKASTVRNEEHFSTMINISEATLAVKNLGFGPLPVASSMAPMYAMNIKYGEDNYQVIITGREINKYAH